MKIITPSYKRAEKCITAKYLTRAIIGVNKSEVDEYRKYNDNDIFEIPNELGGNMARIRNFIKDGFDEDIIMVDDDISTFGYYENNEKVKLEEEQVYLLFGMGFALAREFGAMLWGVNLLEDKQAYKEFTPFNLRNVILGPCMGILNECDIRFDEKLGLKEDYDFSIQVLNKYRKVLRLNKYHYRCGHIKMKGGCASYRTSSAEEEQMKRIERKWGSGIIKYKKGDINPVVRVPISGV